MTAERRTQILESDLARNIAWIAAADAKTGFLLTVATAMLGLEASVAPAHGHWTAAGVFFGSASAALLLASLACAAAAIFPRTKGPRRSLIFFGDVADLNLESFRSRIASRSDEDYIDDLVEQCHINAVIAGKKYTWVGRSGRLLFIAVVPWLVATFILFSDR
jgi:hypothetical protein